MAQTPDRPTPDERRPVNMFDVAKGAGVSHQTVSRVLNDPGAVRESTRHRVNTAIEELGYRRNLAARALATHRSKTLGVVCFDTTLYGPASILYAIEHAARAAGYYVSVASDSTVDSTTLPRALSRLAEQSVEGVVVIAPLAETRQALVLSRSVTPIVAVDAIGGLGLPMVSVDQFDGARQVTRHLLDQGASTVWHVTGAEGWTETEARLAGWRDELTSAGRSISEPLAGQLVARLGLSGRHRTCPPHRRGGRLRRQRSDGARRLARIRRSRSLGTRRCPGGRLRRRTGVGYYSPPLTTVRQDFATVGQKLSSC